MKTQNIRPFGMQFLEVPADDLSGVNGGAIFTTQAISAPRVVRRPQVDKNGAIEGGEKVVSAPDHF